MKNNTTDFSMLCPATLKGYKRQQKNLFGYIVFRHSGYTRQRAEHDDWFYISNAEMLKATGIASKTTLYAYIRQFIADGVIEMQTGDRRHANSYRLTDRAKCTTEKTGIEGTDTKSVPPVEGEKCTTLENAKSVPPVESGKCTTQHADIEETDAKSVLPVGKIGKCTTDITEGEGTITEGINELKHNIHKHNILNRSVKNTYSEGTYSACEGESVGGCECACEIEDLEDYEDYTPNEALAEATDTGDCELCGLGFDLDLSCGCTYTDTNADTYTPTADDYTANATAQATPTQTATYQPQTNRARYWQSWNRFRELVTNGEVTIAEGEKHLKTYISKLAQCYPHPADFTAKHDQLLSQWRYVTDKANKANTNGTETGAQIPQDMAINIKTPYGSVADIIVYAQAARDNLAKAQANRERVDGIPSYIRYYFNAMRRMAKDADVDENRVRSIWDQCVCYSKSKSPDWTFSLDNLK